MIDLKTLTSEIVSAYVAQNRLSLNELPDFIAKVHGALAGAGDHGPAMEEPVAKPTSAQIRKSITPGGLISFIDGKSYRTLKRHLGVSGLTGDDYRKRYGLPADYPMTAPTYSELRSTLAKARGLGRRVGRGKQAVQDADSAASSIEEVADLQVSPDPTSEIRPEPEAETPRRKMQLAFSE